MGAVVSGAEQANNAAMFSTSDTVKLGFTTLDIADKARAAQQAQDTAIMRLQDRSIGVGGGMGMQQQPMMFTGFNHFLYVLGYMFLGLGAVAFCLTYFVPMASSIVFGLSTFFFFFLIQHVSYFVSIQVSPNQFTAGTGTMIFMMSLILGLGLGALWGYAIEPSIDRSKTGDMTIGIISGVVVLFTLITFQQRMRYGGTSMFGGMPMGGGMMQQQPMMQQPMMQQPMMQQQQLQIMQ